MPTWLIAFLDGAKRLPWWRIFGFTAAGGVVIALAGAAAIYVIGTRDLPDHKALTEYAPPTTSRVHAGDGGLIAEFAREHRLFVPIESIPEPVVNAFLSAEDKNFFEHSGVDFMGFVRANITNIGRVLAGRRPHGASTITQQVARLMLLAKEDTVSRKLREMFLSFRIERSLGKDRILEIYLNQIWLGRRSYGVAAAALNYFNKPLADLTQAEAAYLAALPKGPDNYHPERRKAAAIDRRNWVLERMVVNNFITADERAEFAAEDLVTVNRFAGPEFNAASYFVEEVRRAAIDELGEDAVYNGGLSIRSTIDTKTQIAARAALRKGLEAYDRRRSWRGPKTRIELGEGWDKRLAAVELDPDIAPWVAVVVTEIGAKSAKIGFADGQIAELAADDVAWAKRLKREDIDKAQGLQPGDVVYVNREAQEGAPPLDDEASGADNAIVAADPRIRWRLKQIPTANGALVALDPHTGRVLAMVGGYSQRQSAFNRVTQALRQPGSAFKPFVYAAALDLGYTPSSLVLDAPFAAPGGEDGKLWIPLNYSKEFFGPSTLRLGIEKSRNVMTVRLAQDIGMEPIVDYARRFGLYENLPPYLSMSLGAGETTLMQLAAAYATFVNGGKRVEPTVIDRVQDRNGKSILTADARACDSCKADFDPASEPPILPDPRAQILDPVTAFQMASMLEGAVERGTGAGIRPVGKPLGGKTGTSNDYQSVWFVGFSPDLVAGVYVGYDQPKSLGEAESGGRVAAPIFRDFMTDALKDRPALPFRAAPGARLVNVDAKTGQLPGPSTGLIIREAFKPGTEPGAALRARCARIQFGVDRTGCDDSAPTETVEDFDLSGIR